MSRHGRNAKRRGKVRSDDPGGLAPAPPRRESDEHEVSQEHEVCLRLRACPDCNDQPRHKRQRGHALRQNHPPPHPAQSSHLRRAVTEHSALVSQSWARPTTIPTVKPLLLARVAPVLIAAFLAFVTGVGSTDAARQPTFKEREALALALPAPFRRYPIGCVWLRMSVANNGRYAIVAPEFLNATRSPCVQFASNGYWLLKKSARWKVIFNGSVQPPCSLGVPRDLTKCFH
jgi:hypothetical protein